VGAVAGQTETRTYNAFNQFTGVTSPGMNATYTYRADGLRHAKTVNGLMTQQQIYPTSIVLGRAVFEPQRVSEPWEFLEGNPLSASFAYFSGQTEK